MVQKVDKSNVEDIFELVPMQKGMLFHFLKEEGRNLYTVQLSFTILGDLRPDILRKAIGSVQAANAALRSVFRWENLEKPLQIVLKECPMDVVIQDISSGDTAGINKFVEELTTKDREEPFDITKLPFRIRLIRTAVNLHVLNITYHHILFDGWSNLILLKEIFANYDLVSKGEDTPPVEKPSYKRIYQTLYQRDGEDLVRAYWQEYLKDYKPKCLAAVPEGYTGEKAVQKLFFKTSDARLRMFAGAHKVTKAAVIYAAYGILLQKYTGTRDIAFATTFSNRDSTIKGMERVIGNFINTVPLRIGSTEERSLLEVVSGVYADVIAIDPFKGVSYTEIKQYLGFGAADRLYDSVVAIENYPMDTEGITGNPDLSIGLNTVYESTSTPLVITVLFREDLEIEFAFRPDVLDGDEMALLGRYLIRVIEEIVSDPARPAGSIDLPVLRVNQRSGVLREGFRSLLDLFEAQADRTPGNIAMVYGDRRVTYRELRRQAEGIGSWLQKVKGIGPGDLVGVLLERDDRLVACLLGIWKCGAAYVPIDPGYPPDRIAAVVAESGLRTLLTTQKYRNMPAKGEINYVEVDASWAEMISFREALQENGADGQMLAYVLFTSGSTGVPKGVMIEHRSLVNYIKWASNEYAGTKKACFPFFTSISFDLTVTSLFTPLVTGNTIMVYGEGENSVILDQVITESEVDVIKLTPSHLKMIRDSERIALPAAGGVKTFIVGGEDLPAALARAIYDKYEGKAVIYNEYGPTEATVGCMIHRFDPHEKLGSVPIGHPIDHLQIYLLDENLRSVQTGEEGEIYIGGEGLARGYLNNEELTGRRFVTNPFVEGGKIYRTGDLAVKGWDGRLTYKGRLDQQVKIRGFRIEPGDIESHLQGHGRIKEVVVLADEQDGDRYLTAYYVSTDGQDITALREYLANRLPGYMIPAYFVRLAEMPLNINGKLDRKQLAQLKPASDGPQVEYEAATDETEEKLRKLWGEVLKQDAITVNRNFFDAGGDSFKVIALGNKINKTLHTKITINDLFKYPTIRSFAAFIRARQSQAASNGPTQKDIVPTRPTATDIAIIGFAGRFPGAADPKAFWANLQSAKETISTLEKNSAKNAVVRAKGRLEGYEEFDNEFFAYIPTEAAAMDPQMRIFHECVWEALENAGYNPGSYPGYIGLYGGASPNPYFNLNVEDQGDEDFLEKWEALTYADKDFICSRVSYKLNLKGPSININTACSTSLVAVDMACNELLAGKCDMAVAGGVSITLHDEEGYIYRKGMILSPDGKCRAFDKDSAGTVGGNGVGVVILKKLEDALRDRDTIHAVIKSTATNNDGNQKVGFTAPSVEGQSGVIAAAIRKAGIDADSISYIEAHGTATALGDPIEVSALTKAFNSPKRQFCAIGSVKTNIGHLDAASGIAGLIKTILSLQNKQLPASLHYKSPNPGIELADSPFYVNASLKKWEGAPLPRRAGVSSFGIGGTNAHVLLEEAPLASASSPSRDYQLLMVSARTPEALDRNIRRLADHLQDLSGPPGSLADIAYTLQAGREHFAYRRAIVCRDHKEAIELLAGSRSTNPGATDPEQAPQIVFMFSGQGSQYSHMYGDLYRKEPFFKEVVSSCFELVKRISGKDPERIIFPRPTGPNLLDNTEFAQPALFIMEYALARLLMKWGVRPAMMIGHSIGEYTAACLSEVFSLEDALTLVIKRGELMQKAPEGKMLSVPISRDELAPLVEGRGDISIAAVNSTRLCVASGSEESIGLLKEVLDKQGHQSRIMRTSHAFHSYLMDGVLDEFHAAVAKVKMSTPRIPYVSNLTGKVITPAEIASPSYWVDHLRREVNFSGGLESMLTMKKGVFIEVGPGNTLATFVRTHQLRENGHKIITMVRHPNLESNDLSYLLSALGELWMNGVSPDWGAFYEKEQRRRVPLPAYAFEKTNFPVRSSLAGIAGPGHRVTARKPSEWIYAPAWETSALSNGRKPGSGNKCNWVFMDEEGIVQPLAEKLESDGEETIYIRKGDSFLRESVNSFRIDACSENDYTRLSREVGTRAAYRVIFAWGLDKVDFPAKKLTVDRMRAALDTGYYPLLNIARTMDASTGAAEVEIFSLTNRLHRVLSTDLISPEKSPILGAIKVIPKEFANIRCSNIDIAPSSDAEEWIGPVLEELYTPCANEYIAYRHRTRFSPAIKPVRTAGTGGSQPVFRNNGVYLITGGAGGFGLSFAKRISEEVQGASFILLGRRELAGIREDCQMMEKNGSRVHYYNVDVSDEGGMREVVSRAVRELGPVNGVIHTAGVPDYGGLIYKRTREDSEKVFAAKIYGTILLHELLPPEKLDFFVLCSSLSTLLAPLGQVGYVAANIFQENFSRRCSHSGEPNMLSIGWNAWKEVGMAARAAERMSDLEEAADSISPAEGYEMLVRSIGAGMPELIISRSTPDLLLKQGTKGGSISSGDNEQQTRPASEEKLLQLWKEFFGKPDITAGDDFFDIGGDSLKALKMIGRIHKAFNFEVSVADFFKRPTVKELSGYIRGGGQLAFVQRTEKKTHYPVSAVQRGLYFLYEFDRQSIAYNMPLTLLLEGHLDLLRLKESFRALIERHESLRSYFGASVDGPYLRVAEKFDLEIEEYHSDGNEEQVVKRFIRPFDLGKAPLMRVGVIHIRDHQHILMVDLHHIITDGASKAILLADFMSLYHQRELSPLTLQYRDFTEWQHRPRQRERIARQSAFWIRQFAGEVAVLDLPTDFVRPAGKTYAGDSLKFTLGSGDMRVLKEIAEREGATLFMVILSIYNILLSRLSGQEDIVVGTPVVGRRHPDLQGIIGLFVNILPLRNSPRRELSFREFLNDLKSRALASFDNQDYPYEELIDRLNIERDLSRNPLFDTVFFYQNLQQPEFELPGLTVRPFDDHYSTIDYDINLVVSEQADQLILTFEYSTALFKGETIRRFIDGFRNIVSAVIADAGVKISAIDIVSKEEKGRLLYTFNDTRVEVDRYRTFAQLFAEQVERTPLSIAVRHNSDELTYKELFEKSQLLSAQLAARGICAGKKVALHLPRGIDLLTAIIAVFQAGGAYIPLDIDYPDERVREILSDSESELIITMQEGLPAIEQLQQKPQEYGKVFPAADVNSLAYMIYTSGTTGRPKGVMIHQMGMINHLHAKIRDLGLDMHSVVAQSASPCFDISVWQFLAPLLVAGEVCIIDKEKLLNPLALIKELNEKGITVFESVPSLMTTVLDQIADEPQQSLPGLKWMIMTGEPLSVSLARKWHACFPAIKLLNAYGPTEASDDITHHVVALPEEGQTQIPIGRPVQNTRIYILDKCLHLCPIGVTGEICVAGLGVGKGYWKDAGQTNRVFVPNPYASEGEGDRDYGLLYKTGDFGFFLPDGSIICIGRTDEQVKIRGNRIELNEIQTRLTEIEGVFEAVVIVRKSEDQPFLVAYYTARGQMEPDELTNCLSATLPEYMIPSYYVYLNRLPVTSNGKLDRSALPQPKMYTGDEYIAPHTREERLLADVWSKVLGCEKAGITDNFFTMGGDSIKSIQICSRMRIAGYELSVKDIFTFHTIKKIAPRLKRISVLPDQSVITGTAPLTPMQQWSLDDLLPDRHHFNQSVLLNFPAGIHRMMVERIFTKLQEHHDALRMVLRMENGVYIQENKATDLPLSLEEYFLEQGSDPASTLSEAATRIQSSIDLRNGPLMKIGLFHMTDGSRVLIVIHHFVVDGISWRILFEDIETLYRQAGKGEPLSLPLKSDAFLHWPAHLNEYKKSAVFQTAATYWEADVQQQSFELPPDNPDGANTVRENEEKIFTLDKTETAHLLGDASIPFNTQINDLLLTGLLLGIHKVYGHQRIRLDIEGHGRENISDGVDISRTVGWFTSVYPVVLELQEGGLSGKIKQIKEMLRSVPNHGFDYLLYQDPSKKRPGGNIIFNYLGQFDADIKGNSFTIGAENKGDEVSLNKRRQYDWEMWGMVREGQLIMSLTYSRERYRATTIEAFMQAFRDALKELIFYCSAFGKVEPTPSDLTYKKLSIKRLEELQNHLFIEDIYSLSPMQEGMLFHSLLDPSGADYFEQMTYQLRGNLDKAIVEKSINDLVRRYGILRTTFLHDGYQPPLQIVLKERKADFSFLDLREQCNAGRAEEVVESIRVRDRNRGFDLYRDILLRVTMLQTGDDEFQFIWSHHHILMDGWCVGIIIKEFRDIYSKNKKGEEVHLPAVRPYSEYIGWLQSRDKAGSSAFWRNYLESYDSLATLPRKASMGLPRHNERYSVVIGREQTNSLTRVSGKYGVTINAMLQTAWGMLLSRWNNSSDVVFGSVVSGRPAEIEGVENMVGLFINTVPVRVRLRDEDAVADLLKRVQAEALEAEPYHYYSLAEIQAVSELGRGLLDHLFIFLNYPISEEIEGRKPGQYEREDYLLSKVRMYEQTHYDLLVLVIPGDEIRIGLEYNIHAFDPETIRNVAAHFQEIISQMAADGDIRVKDVDMMTTQEKRLLTEEFNDTDADHPEAATIADLIDEQVRRTPDRVAVRFMDSAMTYMDLSKKAGRIAFHLQRFMSIRTGDLVGVLLRRDEYLIPSLLGILKAGAAYVPIDPVYPRERVHSIIQDARISVVITRSEYADLLSGMGITTLDPAVLPDTVENPAAMLLPESAAANLAYVIYTSGSTGIPKGVRITHRNLLNYTHWAAGQYLGGHRAGFALFTSVAFDLTVTSIFVPLITGNEIFCYDDEDGLPLERIIGDDRVNVMKLTPSHLKLMKNLPWKEPASGGRTKIFIVGGEELDTHLAKDIYRKFGGNVEIYNEYGPTEATVGCMIHRYDPNEETLSVPIGVPVNNTQIYLLDERLRPVPAGVDGEIYISGDGVAEGYLDRDDLNRQKFVENPFKQGRKMYRTGDLACRLPGGVLLYKGRIDRQVKIRGFRIELGEIESRLRSHSDIREAVVLPRETGGDKVLVAWYVADKAMEIAALRDWLSARLPDFMQPAYFVPVSALPLTSNGKIDTGALPQPAHRSGTDHQQPANPMEERLAEMWAEVLQTDKEAISVNSGFFEIGGHSLRAMTLIAAIQKEFNVKIPLATFFKRPTILALEREILMIRLSAKTPANLSKISI